MQRLGDFKSAHTLSDKEIECRLVALYVEESAHAAEQLALLTEADRRGIGKAHGYSSAAQWYSKNTRTAEGYVQALITRGIFLSAYPAVADALAAGDIHPFHARAIADGLRSITVAEPTLDESALDAHVVTLLEVALHSTADAVTRRARAIGVEASNAAQARHDELRRRREEKERQRREDEERRRREEEERTRRGEAPNPTPPTGSDQGEKPEPEPEPELGPRPPSPAENAALNTLQMFQLPDGRWIFKANLDVFSSAKLRAALDPLTKPQPEPDGTQDERSPAKRAADGFGTIVDHHLHRRPGSGWGSTAHVNLVVDLKDLSAAACTHPTNPADGLNVPFDLEWAGPVSKSLAELITCDAHFNVIIRDGAGVPLAVGHEFRLATDEQRIAVKIRDRCCVMCGRPASWCEVHHIIYWENRGPTDLDNLALVCGRCHRLVHNDGWQLLMGEDGHPYSIPPAITDPHRTPLPSYHRRRKPHT